MKRWSYKIVEFDSKGIFGGQLDPSITEKLNELGNLGWEMVSNFSTAESGGKTKKIVFTFKREVE